MEGSHNGDDTRSWEMYKLPYVTYSRKHHRPHGFLESYDSARPDQPNKDIIETYYSADVPDMPRLNLDFWSTRSHSGAVREAQHIRQGWIGEIAQSDQTPTYDLGKFGTTPIERSKGILSGLAIGDALGRPVEFWSAAEIQDEYGFLNSFEGYGTHGQPPGTVTDDTEQALCIAASLASRGKWDPEDVAEQFIDWYNSGPFDIGATTSQAMEFLATNKAWDEAGKATEAKLGERPTNGAVMRCAPLAIAYPHDTEKLIRYSRESSFITHVHPLCTYGAAVLNLTLSNFLTYTENPLSTALNTLQSDAPEELINRLSSIENVNEESLGSTGEVLDTLETALYYGLTGSSFLEAVTNAINTGGDTDTVGAVTGAIAGARFGFNPTYEQNKNQGMDIPFFGNITLKRHVIHPLPFDIHEIEIPLGPHRQEKTWRDYISTIEGS